MGDELALVGESEIAMRLLSAVPFVAGVVIVDGLAAQALRRPALRRCCSSSSPRCRPCSNSTSRDRHAATGLAFFAMGDPRRVTALEASRRRPGTLPVVAACAGPASWEPGRSHRFGVAFVATLGSARGLEPGGATRGGSRPASPPFRRDNLAWYAPHLGEAGGRHR